MDLPNEIFFKIFEQLDFSSLYKFSLVDEVYKDLVYSFIKIGMELSKPSPVKKIKFGEFPLNDTIIKLLKIVKPVCIVLGNVKIIPDEYWGKPLEDASAKSTCLYYNRLYYDIEYNKDIFSNVSTLEIEISGIDFLPFIKLFYNIKTLIIKCFLHSFILVEIFKNYKHLKHITIYKKPLYSYLFNIDNVETLLIYEYSSDDIPLVYGLLSRNKDIKSFTFLRYFIENFENDILNMKYVDMFTSMKKCEHLEKLHINSGIIFGNFISIKCVSTLILEINPISSEIYKNVAHVTFPSLKHLILINDVNRKVEKENKKRDHITYLLKEITYMETLCVDEFLTEDSVMYDNLKYLCVKKLCKDSFLNILKYCTSLETLNINFYFTDVEMLLECSVKKITIGILTKKKELECDGCPFYIIQYDKKICKYCNTTILYATPPEIL